MGGTSRRTAYDKGTDLAERIKEKDGTGVRPSAVESGVQNLKIYFREMNKRGETGHPVGTLSVRSTQIKCLCIRIESSRMVRV